MEKILFDRAEAWKAEKNTGGDDNPRYNGTNKRSAEGSKDYLSPFQGFRVLGVQYRGWYPPSVVFSPLRGFWF